jgi:hypothetical protein
MKKLAIYFSLCLMFDLQNLDGQIAVPVEKNTFYSTNAWYINVAPTIPADIISTIGPVLASVAATGCKFVRIGGFDPNWKPLYSFNAAGTTTLATNLIYLINQIRNAGMDVIVQVGHNPVCSALTPLGPLSFQQQAQTAGTLVNLLNNSGALNRKVDFWSIANEPNMSIVCTFPGAEGFEYDQESEAGTIASYVKAYATEMKNADPMIQIIGPEMTSFGSDVGFSINKLMAALLAAPTGTGASTSILGKISSPGNPGAISSFTSTLFPSITTLDPATASPALTTCMMSLPLTSTA